MRRKLDRIHEGIEDQQKNYGLTNKFNQNQPRFSSNNNFNNRNTFSERNLECYFCHKRGHTRSECWSYTRYLQNTDNPNQFENSQGNRYNQGYSQNNQGYNRFNNQRFNNQEYNNQGN